MRSQRIVIDVILLLAIIFLPYYIYLPALLIAILVLPFFWEGILLGFLVDVLYGDGIRYGLWSLAVLLAVLPMRRFLRAYV